MFVCYNTQPRRTSPLNRCNYTSQLCNQPQASECLTTTACGDDDKVQVAYLMFPNTFSRVVSSFQKKKKKKKASEIRKLLHANTPTNCDQTVWTKSVQKFSFVILFTQGSTKFWYPSVRWQIYTLFLLRWFVRYGHQTLAKIYITGDALLFINPKWRQGT